MRAGVVAGLVGLVGLAGRAAEPVTLVRDGQPRAAVVVARATLDKGGKAADAARDLVRYVGRISGAKLPLVGDDQVPAGTAVLVGRSRLTDALKLDVPGGLTPARREEGYLIRVRGDRVVLAGNDEGPYHGTEYAVVDFLERLGVRWYLPGEFGEVVPRKTTVEAAETDGRHAPDFVMRNYWSHVPQELQAAEKAWKIRNRLNPDPAFAIPGDSSVRALLPEGLLKTNPEAFATKADGGKDPHLPSLTHPKAVEVAAGVIREHFKKNPASNS